MENLVIKNSNRKLAGIIWIAGGIILLIAGLASKEPQDFWDWMKPVIFCLIGIILFTPLVGSDKAKIEVCEGSLKVRWINWYRSVTVRESEIESIILAKNGIMIRRKDNKPLKIKFYLIEKDQKELVYRFFTEYAHEKGFNREKKLDQI